MRAIGLTGGMGCGKSTVAGLLAERGATVLDADRITRALQRPGQSVYEAIVERFGDEVVAPDGSLDRGALAAVVFEDRAALVDLERLVHPEVAAAMGARVAAAAGTNEVLVLDVPLLVEATDYPVAGVVVVDCPIDTAVRRLVAHRGLAEADVRARIARQASRDERLARADVVVDNAGPPEALDPQIDRVWAWIQTLPDA
ncbi:MAG TPA: dephospho-CoA kinase [Acidimicrobiales bacterium]|nr:dephospho-CoA kinase [Acidimicrobiales bacterium]